MAQRLLNEPSGAPGVVAILHNRGTIAAKDCGGIGGGKSTLKGKNLKGEMLDLTNKLMLEAVALHTLRMDMMELTYFRNQTAANVLPRRPMNE